jgi:hypothetical protein
VRPPSMHIQSSSTPSCFASAEEMYSKQKKVDCTLWLGEFQFYAHIQWCLRHTKTKPPIYRSMMHWCIDTLGQPSEGDWESCYRMGLHATWCPRTMSDAYMKHFRGALTSMIRIRSASLNCALCSATEKSISACLQASAALEDNMHGSGFKKTA